MREGGMEFLMGVENDPLVATIHHLLDFPDEVEKAVSAPGRAYVRDRKAMASIPTDVKAVPGAKSGDIKVQVEDDRTLVVCGERRRADDKDAKYQRMERRMGKFMRKFTLPEDADLENITATCQDGVLTVRVAKMPPPEPKKPKTIAVKVGGGGGSNAAS